MNTKTLILIILLVIVLFGCSFLGYTTLQSTLKPNNTTQTTKSSSLSTTKTSYSSLVSSSVSSKSSSTVTLSNSSKSLSSISSTSISTNSSQSSSSNTSEALTSGQLKVYLIKNNSTVDYVLRDSTKTDPLDRIVDAMNAKMKGPNSTESSEGFAKDIVMSGTANCYDNAGNLRTNSDGTTLDLDAITKKQ